MKNKEFLKGKSFIKCNGAGEGMITGSCWLLGIRDSRIIVDDGLFQGKYEERSSRGVRRNFDPMNKIAKEVTDIIHTHPHIDHIGRTPMVFKNGLTPTILSTKEAADFTEKMLYNSAEIQEKENPFNQLYDKYDVEKTILHLKPVKPFTEIPIGQKYSGITAELDMNGHIVGSASVMIRDHQNLKSILFTGDMGKPKQSLCGGYEQFVDKYPDDPVNTMVVECTNFTKEPISFAEKQNNFYRAINDTWDNGGNPLIASLSMHRFPEIVEMIHNGQKEGKIREDCNIYIDAPLAVDLLGILKSNPNYMTMGYGEESNYYKTLEESIGRFNLDNSMIIDTHKNSQLVDKVLAFSPYKNIILASGGMGNYGRMVNYVRGDFGKNPKNSVILTCFQVRGTQGAELLHQGTIKIGKKNGARVVKVDGFTSHISGPKETFDYLEKFNLSELEKIIINHGNDISRRAMAKEFKQRGYGAQVFLPDIHDTIEL